MFKMVEKTLYILLHLIFYLLGIVNTTAAPAVIPFFLSVSVTTVNYFA